MENTIRNGVLIPIDGMLILPETNVVLSLEESDSALERYLENPDSLPIALPVHQGMKNEGTALRFHRLGVSFTLKNMQHKDGKLVLEVRMHERVKVSNITQEGELTFGDWEPYLDKRDLDPAMEAEILEYLKNIVREISAKFKGGQHYLRLLDRLTDVNSMIVWVARYVPMTAEERYEFLKTDSLRERSLHFMDLLLKKKEEVDWNIQIHERISDKSNKFYRDQVLREQMKAIQEELGENADGSKIKKKNYKQRIEEAGMPEEIKNAALAELDKLNQQQQGSAETNIIQNYLDFMLALPWKKEELREPDLSRARQVLDEDHYGLEKVKKRILEHLAVMRLRKDNRGSILLLVGPPGTGKTSLGRSIARALDRKYIRISLGGVRDESEIRGHRRTYVGAMPGRILNSIRRAGSTAPVMVLDEVDKLMAGGFSGDPASALLEVLDPEQNSTFTDHYLDLPYDLSNVFFIATANTIDSIPAPLLDRMEMIEISSYTEEEKYHIAMDHLIPEVIKDTGLMPGAVTFEEEAVRKIISDYTREGGVRGLKKALLSVTRAVSAEIVEKSDERTADDMTPEKIAAEEISGNIPRVTKTIRTEDLEELLGHRVIFHDRAQKSNPPGVVTGLAWTPVGGEILFIEAQDMPGTGQVILTGKLGDVMQESARISLSLLKSRLPLSVVNFKERDLHIHVPTGAVPKDGPSAGIALFTALASLFTGHQVDSHLAMTGEITLRGAVMPIGGLKEKLLAAVRAGITKALIPKANLADLAELPEEVKKKLEIVPVETVEEVLSETLAISLPKPEHILYMGEEGTPLQGAHPAEGPALELSGKGA